MDLKEAQIGQHKNELCEGLHVLVKAKKPLLIDASACQTLTVSLP